MTVADLGRAVLGGELKGEDDLEACRRDSGRTQNTLGPHALAAHFSQEGAFALPRRFLCPLQQIHVEHGPWKDSLSSC